MALGTIIIVFTIILIISKRNSEGDPLITHIFYGIIGSFVFTFFFSVIFNINNNKKRISFEETYTNEYKILALNDNISSTNNISGTFFLGSGSIQGSSGPVLNYFFYTEKNNELISNNFAPSQINVFLTNDTSAVYKVTVHHYIRTIDPVWKYFVFHNDRSEHWDITKRIVYVPRGSVKQNYNFDLK